MPENLDILAQRAAVRRAECSAIKTQEAAQEETVNFEMIENLVYEEITA